MVYKVCVVCVPCALSDVWGCVVCFHCVLSGVWGVRSVCSACTEQYMGCVHCDEWFTGCM